MASHLIISATLAPFVTVQQFHSCAYFRPPNHFDQIQNKLLVLI